MRIIILVLFLLGTQGAWAGPDDSVNKVLDRMLNEIEAEYFESDVTVQEDPIAQLDRHYDEQPETHMALDKNGDIQVKKKKRKLAKKSKVKRLQSKGSAVMELTYSTPVWNIESLADGEEFHITGMTDRARKKLDSFSRLTKQRCLVKGRFDGEGVYITALKRCKRLAVADNDSFL